MTDSTGDPTNRDDTATLIDIENFKAEIVFLGSVEVIDLLNVAKFIKFEAKFRAFCNSLLWFELVMNIFLLFCGSLYFMKNLM